MMQKEAVMAKRPPIPQGVRFNVLRRDGFKCRYCGKGSPETILHLDHVKPYSIGGEDTEDNLVTACVGCNYGKGAKADVAVPVQPASQPVTVGGVPVSSEGFCGLFGHSFKENGKLFEQFYIFRQVAADMYACLRFEWAMGYPSDVVVKSATDLAKCTFYTSEDAWNEGYENISRREDRF